MNIKIAKSSYKNKDNKRAIIFDCSAKNYRKKINTGVFIDEEYFENEKFTIPISLLPLKTIKFFVWCGWTTT